MKKIIAMVLAVAIMLCVCGCKSSNDDTSSGYFDVEYQEIVVGGDETVDDTNNKTTQSGGAVNSNSKDNLQKTDSSAFDSANNTADTGIDYNTVVEVDLCSDVVRSYLNATTADKQYYWLSNYSGSGYDYQSLPLDWNFDGSSKYTAYISENADFSNAYVIETAFLSIDNTMLVPGKTYYWKVMGTVSDKPLGGGKIHTKDAPVRWVTIDGAKNVRDMGGWKTSNGKTVKYGMLYRGQNIDNISDDGIKTIKQLGLKTELDLRYESQKNQKQGTGMNYLFLKTEAQYDRIFDDYYADEVKTNYKKIFELLSDESNYPFYTHCSAGADRTGTFAFLTNGLLGVSYEDLTRDFELTSFSSSGKRWRGAGTGGTFADNDLIMQEDNSNYVAWGKLYKRMMEYGAKNGCSTLPQSIEHYLVNYVGVPKSQIDSFKNIMLK